MSLLRTIPCKIYYSGAHIYNNYLLNIIALKFPIIHTMYIYGICINNRTYVVYMTKPLDTHELIQRNY